MSWPQVAAALASTTSTVSNVDAPSQLEPQVYLQSAPAFIHIYRVERNMYLSPSECFSNSNTNIWVKKKFWL